MRHLRPKRRWLPKLSSATKAERLNMKSESTISSPGTPGSTVMQRRCARTFLRGWLLIGIMLLIVVVVLFSMLPNETAGLLATGAVALMFWLAYPAYYRWKVSRLARSIYSVGVSNLVGRRRLSLSADYVAFSSPLSQTIMRWAGIERIVVQREVIYLLISQISAIIVPRRAFANDEQFDAFARTAEELHHAKSPLRPNQ